MQSYDPIHHAACADGALTYRDPVTGYSVFTALAHEARGTCCGCGCRHCPFGHALVPPLKRKRPRDPFLEGPNDDTPCDVLFWSGGKDSYLALRALQREAARPVVLLTTFEDHSELVAHQQVALSRIRDQARALGLPLLLIPLWAGPTYTDRVALGLQLLTRRRAIRRIAFGDLHLQHIRAWRETHLAPLAHHHGASLHLPRWGADYAALCAELEAAPVTCTISAVDPRVPTDVLKVGDLWTPRLHERLPPWVDAFGENGEFHTVIGFD